MARTLTIVVVVVCLLSIASLSLGIVLFQQREVLKGRIHKLERTHRVVASTLGFRGAGDSALLDYERMDAPLRGLRQAAVNTVDLLETTSNRLVDVEMTLDQTEKDLAATEWKLQDAREEVARLNHVVDERDLRIAKQAQLIEELEFARADLSAQVDGLRNDLDVTQAELRDRRAEIESWRQDYEKLVEECTQGDDEEVDILDVEFFGKILTVAPEWNFVVIQGGADQHLKPNVDLLVHRRQQVLGKVRVQSVEATMAVAAVIARWSDQPIAVGDDVISPEPPQPASST